MAFWPLSGLSCAAPRWIALGFVAVFRGMWFCRNCASIMANKKGRLTAVFIKLWVAIADQPATAAAAAPFAARYPKNPIPMKPSNIMVQVDGSGTAVMLNVPPGVGPRLFQITSLFG